MSPVVLLEVLAFICGIIKTLLYSFAFIHTSSTTHSTAFISASTQRGIAGSIA